MKIIQNKELPSAIIRIWKRKGKCLRLKIDGHSMYPYFRKGDDVELSIKEINIHALKIGDIIAFLQDNKIIVHRYIKKKKVGQLWKVCQRGDHLHGFRWIDAEQIIGTATAIHRKRQRIDLLSRYQILWNRFSGYSGWLWIWGLETRLILKGHISHK
jgi:signal peptidase I